MVTISVERDDLESLIGKRLPTDLDELNDLLSYLKCEASQQDTELSSYSIELKDTNRPDLWSPEGIARALRGVLGIETGEKPYRVLPARSEVVVDKRLREVRPFIACVVAKGLRLSDTVIRGLIQLQEKLDGSYGRKRRGSSIGFYDFDLLKPPLKYTVASPEAVKFVPLEETKPMTLNEILAAHPKGIEYGHIVSNHKQWPILLDSDDEVLSFPPIINSNDLGRITESTSNVLVEVTGTKYETVLNTLTILSASLADRGAELGAFKIRSPFHKPTTTPSMRPSFHSLRVEYVRRMLELEITPRQICSLLRKMRFGVREISRSSIKVWAPCYRLDIMHSVDLVEDIAIAYGLNKISPRWPPQLTFGAISKEEEFGDLLRGIMIGLGFQEVLTFTLTSPEKLFEKMRSPPDEVVELLNPKLTTMTCMRGWLLPSLMEVMGANTHVAYPQRIFELGTCVAPNERYDNRAEESRRLACLIAHASTSFTEAKSYLDSLLINLGMGYEIEEISHPSFIEGRVGQVLLARQPVGLVGEIHPQVIRNWGIENPVAGFELDADKATTLRGAT